MKRILVNAVNLNKGGGVQVATSLIINFCRSSEHEFFFVVSKEVWSEVRNMGVEERAVRVFDSEKINGIARLLRIKQVLEESERKFSPDAALSIFGPVFWRPGCTHLSGFAIPHYLYHGESPFFTNLPFGQRINLWLLKNIHLRILKYSSDGFYTETEDASQKLSRAINRRVDTINNALNDKLIRNEQPKKGTIGSIGKVIVVSAYYPHKNLDILSEVDKKLGEMNISTEFHFTLSEFPESLKEIRNYTNHGRVGLEDLGKLYGEVDALLLPTLLECFTASFLEASYFQLPIITSNLSFAHTICGDDAVYFDPMNANDIAKKLISVFRSQEGYDKLVTKSNAIYRRFPSSMERAKRTIELLIELNENYCRRF